MGQAEEELRREGGAGEGGVQRALVQGEPCCRSRQPVPHAQRAHLPVTLLTRINRLFRAPVRGCSGCRLPSGAGPQWLRG